jgi:hypothetical protein
MALRAAAHTLLVKPSEPATSLVVVRESQQSVMQGVVLDVGKGVSEDVETGDLVFYTGSYTLPTPVGEDEKHIVPTTHLIAIDDGE